MKAKERYSKNKVDESQPPRVLAVDPHKDGFGYVVFESPNKLIDWGVTTAFISHQSRALLRFEDLIDYYKPNVIVIENTNVTTSLRKAKARKMLTNFANKAVASIIPVKRYSWEHVRSIFSEFDAHSKEEIADSLVEWLPKLDTYRPPRREIWDTENRNMAIFDAAALAITFYASWEDSKKN